MDIETIYQAEPELRDMIHSCKVFCMNGHNVDYRKRLGVYNDAKEYASKLVGYGAREPCLRSNVAYECFIKKLANALNV